MRLIDADELKDQIIDEIGIIPTADMKDTVPSAISFVNRLNMAPTIDAVPVVRCKECIHSDDGWLCDSPFHGGRTFPGDYCSNGERKENGLYKSLKRGLEEAIAYENGEIECRTETRKEDADEHFY